MAEHAAPQSQSPGPDQGISDPSQPSRPEPDQIRIGRGGLRSAIDRSFELGALSPSLPALDASLEAAHDVACQVFQRWLDGLCGQACALLSENEKLAKIVMDRAQSFGFGLYIRYGDELVRVRISASAPSNKSVLASDHPALYAGAFHIHQVREPGADSPPRSGKLTARPTFPRLLVARSCEHAHRLIEGETAASEPAANEVSSLRRPDLEGWNPGEGN